MTEPLSRPSPTSSRARTAQPAQDPREADPLPDPDEPGTEPDRASPPGTPRWVKAFGIMAIVVTLLFVGMHLTGHVPTHTPPASSPGLDMQAP